MKLLQIISASIKGTSAMTLFSYVYSRKANRQFREPVLLAHLLAGNKSNKKETLQYKHIVGGWAIHYLVGITFLISYDMLRRVAPLSKIPANGLVLGGLYGLVGVAGWQTMFAVHPRPPKIAVGHYFAHLIPAHMVYGHFAFNSLDKKEEDK